MDNRQNTSELAEKYVRGELQGKELSQFKELLAKDNALKEEVLFHREIQLISNQVEEDFLQEQCRQWAAELDEKDDISTDSTNVVGSKNRFKDFLYVASIAAIMAVTWFGMNLLLPKTTAIELAEIYWEDQTRLLNVVRGDDNDAFKLFEEGQYAEANEYLSTVPDSSELYTSALLLSGICYYMADETKTGINLIRRIANDRTKVISEEARWRLILALIKEKDYNTAKTLLDEFEDLQGYSKEAKRLLRRIPGDDH
ncbi:MAG: tetratricopeptide repeat protein [Chitinophagales bacterium]